MMKKEEEKTKLVSQGSGRESRQALRQGGSGWLQYALD